MRSVIFLITVLFLTVTTSAFSVEAVNTTDRNDPFVQVLEAQYTKYYNAGNSGNLEVWLMTRTAKVADQIKKSPGVTPDVLKQASKGNSNLMEFDFVSVETKGDVARILHKKVSADSLIIEAALFHKEGGEWKLGDGTQLNYSGDMAKDYDGALKEILANPKVQMP
jgi:hypothetical protein